MAGGRRSLRLKRSKAVESGTDDDENAAIVQAKKELRAALEEHHGETRHPQVQKAVAKLTQLNPTSKPARSCKIIGDFVTICSPHFPGRTNIVDDKENYVYQYTLGRLSFGLFEPRSLVCTLRRVQTHIRVIDQGQQSSSHHLQEQATEAVQDDASVTTLKEEFFSADSLLCYPLVCYITIHTPEGDLDAILDNRAHSSPTTPTRQSVTFLGATLLPDPQVLHDTEKFALWKRTFAGAYAKADAERTFFGSVWRYLLRKALKLSMPSDEEARNKADNSFSFEIKRAPRGHYDVLYLDDEIRISRGNRGTIVVLERLRDDTEEAE